MLGDTKPADLPIQHPTRFEMVVNLRTAKVLGITVPEMVLVRAKNTREQSNGENDERLQER
jgi:putative ABC transport system substrate-binding protein